MEKGQLGPDEVIHVVISFLRAIERFGNLQHFIPKLYLPRCHLKLTYLSRKSLSTVAEMSSKGFPIPRIISSLTKKHNKLENQYSALKKVVSRKKSHNRNDYLMQILFLMLDIRKYQRIRCRPLFQLNDWFKQFSRFYPNVHTINIIGVLLVNY